jgi:hypothetical protein
MTRTLIDLVAAWALSGADGALGAPPHDAADPAQIPAPKVS